MCIENTPNWDKYSLVCKLLVNDCEILDKIVQKVEFVCLEKLTSDVY